MNKLQSTSSLLLHWGKICPVPGVKCKKLQGEPHSSFSLAFFWSEENTWSEHSDALVWRSRGKDVLEPLLLYWTREVQLQHHSQMHVNTLHFLFSVANISQKDYKVLEIELQCFNAKADAPHSLQLDLFANTYSVCHIWLLTSIGCLFLSGLPLYRHHHYLKALPPVWKWHQTILWHRIDWSF